MTPHANLTRPDVLIFDWDNTLVDAWGGVTQALNATFGAFGRPRWTRAETLANVRGSLRDTFPAMFGDRWTEARDIFYAALEATHLDHVAPMPGADTLWPVLARWPCAVVSNKTGRYLRAEAAHLGWTDHFLALVGAGDAAADKPHPAAIGLARQSLAPGHAWYIGDTAMDMRAARAAGCSAILIGDAAHDGGIAAAAPDAHIRDLETLSKTLRALVSDDQG